MKRKVFVAVLATFFLLAGSIQAGFAKDNQQSRRNDEEIRTTEANKFFYNDTNNSSGKESKGVEKEIIDAFDKRGNVRVLYRDEKENCLEFLWFNERIPLTIDILMSSQKMPDKIIYLLPGSGSNFRSNFFTPVNDNLACFLREKGYLVIGITPSENNVPYFFQKCAFMKEWGLEKHRNDIREVISVIENKLEVPYEILGYSAGGMYTLDYASVYHSDKLLKRIVVLGMVGEYNPVKERDLREKAVITEEAAKKVIENRIYIDNSMSLAKLLAPVSVIFPYGDSGIERGDFPGDFTDEGLIYYMLIHTNQLEGPTTKYTGMSENWYYEQGLCSGEYIFDENPKKDKYQLGESNISVIKKASLRVGSGIFPYKTTLDFFSVLAGGIDYSIDFRLIEANVTWINSELGMGNHSFALDKIREGGNSNVSFCVVPEYGHADLVYGSHAKGDVWSFID